MDPNGTAYPTVTDKEMSFILQVSSASEVEAFEEKSSALLKDKNTIHGVPRNVNSSSCVGSQGTCSSPLPLGHPLSVEDNMGWFIAPFEGFERIYGDVCLTEVKRLVEKLGISYHKKKIEALRKQAERRTKESLVRSKEVPINKFEQNQVISDHAEDTRLMKAPWGSGDSLRYEKMPHLLRHLSRQVQQAFPELGRLRHVYVEYAPLGQFYKEPRSPKAFDGHDYVIMPFRRDHKESVITFVPALRSKFSSLHEVMKNSWTNRDVDVKVPNGAMLHVYGRARYDWGWGIRPGGAWWGSSVHQLCRGEEFLAEMNETLHTSKWYPCSLFSSISQLLPLPKRRKECQEEQNSPNKSDCEAAIFLFHFEGPRSKGKKRSLFFHPESLIFGFPPDPENYEKWEEDRPTEATIREVGVVKYLFLNYLTMFRVS